MMPHKIEARGSSVSFQTKAQQARELKGNIAEAESRLLHCSLLGRRRTSGGLSRKWSAIECKRPGMVKQVPGDKKNAFVP